jgi:hypothetical protein
MTLQNNSRLLILDNPQATSLYGHTVSEWLAGSKLVPKWPFLIDLLREGKAALYDDGRRSMTFPNEGKWIQAEPFLHKAELYLWLLIHRLNPFRVRIVKDLRQLSAENVLFSFYIGRMGVAKAPDDQAYQDCKSIKMVHMSHCMCNPRLGAANLERLGVSVLMAEADLSDSGYFEKYFGALNLPFLVLPYGFSERFRRTTAWVSRAGKCAATGTFQRIGSQEVIWNEFTEYFKTDTFHPLRRNIFQHRDQLADVFDIRMSDLDAEIEPATERHPANRGSPLRNVYEFARKYYEERMRPFHGRRKYYDFDIVSFYNANKLFVVPEEHIGLPPIGFVEGMACGAGYLGLDHDMYRDLGMVPGVHYIPYDGSLEDLVEMVRYYLANDDRLRAIANSGHEFISANLSGEMVKQRFLDELRDLQTSSG